MTCFLHKSATAALQGEHVAESSLTAGLLKPGEANVNFNRERESGLAKDVELGLSIQEDIKLVSIPLFQRTGQLFTY